PVFPANFGGHLRSSPYHSSDYDLSSFNSHKFGLGLRFEPLYGLGRFRLFSPHRVTLFKFLELRYAYYQRADGLDANLLSLYGRFVIR
ncbi:MAG: hypothetical protein HC880_17670, partial [Bacteroidia bacterium]|nr:hypothetical protein [Bacteroidia bacterium]